MVYRLKSDVRLEYKELIMPILSLYLIDMSFNAFANRADPDLTDIGLLCLLIEK